MTEPSDHHILCPVCHDLLLIPRMYSCGHNVCEECMIKADEAIRDDTMSMALPIYKCPICRNESISEWHDRPINTSLIDVLSKISSDYKLRHDTHKKRDVTDITERNLPNGINLGYVCKHMREFRTEEIYNRIVPLLYKAALQGKPYVTISSETHDISLIADLLAKRLIDKNGIYRLIANQRECQIELVPSERSYRYEYNNENYDPSIPILASSRATAPDVANTDADNNMDDGVEVGESNDTALLPIADAVPEPSTAAATVTERDVVMTSSSGIPGNAEIISVTVHDVAGNVVADDQSRQVSNMLVNHILQNLQHRR